MLHVQRETFLGAVEPDEMRGLAEHGLVVAAGEIADLRAFDNDPPCAEICELPRGERRSHGLLKRNDGYAFEWEHSSQERETQRTQRYAKDIQILKWKSQPAHARNVK